MVTFSITLSDRPRASISRCLNAEWDRKRFAIVSARDARPGIGPRIPGAIVARLLPRVKRGLGTIDPLAVPEELEIHAGHIPVFPNRLAHSGKDTAVHTFQGPAPWIVQYRDEIEVGKRKLVLRQHEIFFWIKDCARTRYLRTRSLYAATFPPSISQLSDGMNRTGTTRNRPSNAGAAVTSHAIKAQVSSATSGKSSRTRNGKARMMSNTGFSPQWPLEMA
jgi:hypothetical protein